MKKRIFALILTVFSSLLILSVSTAFALDADIDSMSNEELILLLQSILQKLEGEGTAETESAAGPLTANDEATAAESRLFQVYKNKKLITEALPSYMFIRPEKKDERPETTDSGDPGTPGETDTPGQTEDPGGPEPCREGEMCVPDDWYCRYELSPDGVCRCMCG